MIVVETERLLLREMRDDDFHALCKVLSNSDVMQHYPYAFDEDRVRGGLSDKSGIFLSPCPN